MQIHSYCFPGFRHSRSGFNVFSTQFLSLLFSELVAHAAREYTVSYFTYFMMQFTSIWLVPSITLFYDTVNNYVASYSKHNKCEYSVIPPPNVRITIVVKPPLKIRKFVSQICRKFNLTYREKNSKFRGQLGNHT